MFTTSFLMPVTTWNNGQTTAANMLRTNVQSGISGASNSATLAVADADLSSGTQVHAAADVCQNMTYGGYDDWYLPGSAEARTLFLNRSSLPVQSGTIWTSSEVSNSTAREFNVGTGALLSTTKSSTRALLCVRKETVPGLVHASDCGTASVNGQACANGSVRFVGVDGSGMKVFTTAFQFPNAFWNGGLTTSANMLATNQRSLTDGSLNTAAVAIADADLTSGTQIHNAASICDQLNVGGFADWYLPAITEAEFLYANRAGLPTIGAIWSSTEVAASTAISLTALGARSTLGKATELNVQCVRRNP